MHLAYLIEVPEMSGTASAQIRRLDGQLNLLATTWTELLQIALEDLKVVDFLEICLLQEHQEDCLSVGLLSTPIGCRRSAPRDQKPSFLSGRC